MTAINLFVRFLSGEQQRYWSEEEAARGEEARLKDEGHPSRQPRGGFGKDKDTGSGFKDFQQ